MRHQFFILVVSTIIVVFTTTNHVAAKTYDLPPLPFGTSSLKPMISKRTLTIHHDMHHAKYVNTLNDLVSGTSLENQSLEYIIKTSYKHKQTSIFNNAAQAWNHSFYWKCLTPNNGGGTPDEIKHAKLLESINKSFVSYGEFRKQFCNAANTAFGSGWAWLVADRKGNLSIMKTIGADNPIVVASGKYIPILTCDVWEHAYYHLSNPCYQNVPLMDLSRHHVIMVRYDIVTIFVIGWVLENPVVHSLLTTFLYFQYLVILILHLACLPLSRATCMITCTVGFELCIPCSCGLVLPVLLALPVAVLKSLDQVWHRISIETVWLFGISNCTNKVLVHDNRCN